MKKNNLIENIAKLLLRLSIGGLMLPHGIFKIQNGMRFIEGLLAQSGLPYWAAPGVLLGEVVAPILLILGYHTRLAGAIVGSTMGMAIFLAHRPVLWSLIPATGGWSVELNMLFLMGGVCIALLGPGTFGLSRGKGRWD